MGLDITAFSNMELLGKHDIPAEYMDEPYDYCYDQGHERPYLNDAFAARFEGLEEVCYVKTPETETHAFRAGNYGGYGVFRKHLAACFLKVPEPNYVGQPLRQYDEIRDEYWDKIHSLEGEPFWEMIDFSDCEGAIGPVVSKKLHQDFLDGADQWDNHVQTHVDPVSRDWYLRSYVDWALAFDLARNDGWVDFH